LKASEERYRRLFEAARDGILILDAASGEIEDVNPYLCELLSYRPDEFLGKHLWQIGAFHDIAASQEAFRTLQEKEYIRYNDLPLQAKDGRLASVEFISNVYAAGDKKVIQGAGIVAVLAVHAGRAGVPHRRSGRAWRNNRCQ
jgi:PAS domain S-box-containing protein